MRPSSSPPFPVKQQSADGIRITYPPYAAMPFELTWKKRGFYSRFWGEITEWEITEKNRVFSNDPRCDKCRFQIFDGTDITSLFLTTQGIAKMASNDIGLATYLKNLSVALVSPKAEIKQVYQEYVSICHQTSISWRFEICDTLEEAKQWLSEQHIGFEIEDF